MIQMIHFNCELLFHFLDEDPCINGRDECGPHSQCVVDGDSFRFVYIPNIIFY